MEHLSVGMAVRDAGGQRLGKVARIYPWGFEVVRGFWSPYQWVFRHGEVTRIADGTVEVARRRDDLMRLAAGELPESWRGKPLPFGARSVPAAPAEARGAEKVLAAGPADATRLSADEERRAVLTRGQSVDTDGAPGVPSGGAPGVHPQR